MTQSSPLSPSAKKFQDALNASGVDLQVVELPASTRTAQEAAQAVGCHIGQIVKSLVFRRVFSGEPVLILASGMNRVNEDQVGHLVGEAIGKADADYVRSQTGYSIGGVPPLGHEKPIMTLVDEDLMQYQYIWAAAGTPNAVFRLEANDLPRLTAGKVVCIR